MTASTGAGAVNPNRRRPRAGLFDDNPALEVSLLAAVQLTILEIAGWTPEQRLELAPDWSQMIAEHGDDLQYGGKHCAPAFNALAKGLAVGAYQPGGVTFAGLHWCAGSNHNGTRDPWPCAAEIAREATETNTDTDYDTEAHP